MGVGDSEGRIHDFAGPYYIALDNFMVGRVTKYLPIDPVSNDLDLGSAAAAGDDGSIPDSAVQRWDNSIREADHEFGKTMHNICCNNWSAVPHVL